MRNDNLHSEQPFSILNDLAILPLTPRQRSREIINQIVFTDLKTTFSQLRKHFKSLGAKSYATNWGAAKLVKSEYFRALKSGNMAQAERIKHRIVKDNGRPAWEH